MHRKRLEILRHNTRDLLFHMGTLVYRPPLSAFFAIKIQLKQKNINRAIDSIPIWPKPFFSEKHDEDILQGIVAGDVRFYPLLDLRGRFGKA